MTDCIVDDFKIKNYLLDINHPVGGGKAKFFLLAVSRRTSRLYSPKR